MILQNIHNYDQAKTTNILMSNGHMNKNELIFKQNS